ncbi:MAG: hypothetical protein ACE14P_15000 [Methanotrichaceae archaeon]
MTNRTYIYAIIIYAIIGFLLLAGTSLGGLDTSVDNGAKNLSMADFSAMGVGGTAENDMANIGAPEVAATAPGTELAAFITQAPPAADLQKPLPSAILANPPRYMYYNGKYLTWRDFSSTFPGIQPGLWIQRAVSWSFYATLPLGGWTQELLYVPTGSTLTMYEIYPSGYVIGYNLGFVNPGYYYIWYYADTVGRHRNILATSTGFSNSVIIDVYGIWPYPHPNPIQPDPKKECEKNPNCYYVNGNCQCVMPDPEKMECESNPLCDYVDGHCYCRGVNPQPEPMPGPVPNPNPEPNPGPFNPAPNPVAQCEQDPNCHWANGRCLCTGFNPSGGSDISDDIDGLGATATGPIA